MEESINKSTTGTKTDISCKEFFVKGIPIVATELCDICFKNHLIIELDSETMSEITK